MTDFTMKEEDKQRFQPIHNLFQHRHRDMGDLTRAALLKDFEKTSPSHFLAYSVAQKFKGKKWIDLQHPEDQNLIMMVLSSQDAERTRRFTEKETIQLFKVLTTAGMYQGEEMNPLVDAGLSYFGSKIPHKGVSYITSLHNILSSDKGVFQGISKGCVRNFAHLFKDEQTLRRFLNDNKEILLDPEAQIFISSEVFSHQLEELRKEKENCHKIYADNRQYNITDIDINLMFIQGEERFNTRVSQIKSICSFVHNLGTFTKSPVLQKIAVSVTSAVDVYKGSVEVYKAFNAASKILNQGGQIGLDNFLCIGDPLSMALNAGLQLFSCWMKSQKEDGMQVLAKQLQEISKQIYELHKEVHELRKEMHELFEQNFKNQKLILDTMCELFSELNKLLNSRFEEFGVPTLSALYNIQRSIKRLLNFTHTAITEVQISKFSDVLNEINSYLEKRQKDSSGTAIQAVDTALLNWISGSSHAAPYAADSLHTGVILQDSADGYNYEMIVEDLKDLNPESIELLVGYFANYAQKYLKLDIFEKNKINVQNIINPIIWLNGVNRYVAFRSRYHDLISDPDLMSIGRVKAVGENTLRCIESIQESRPLFERLFNNYQKDSSEADDFMQKLFAQKREDIFKKEILTHFKNEDMGEIPLDITKSLDDLIQMFTGKLPKEFAVLTERFNLKSNFAGGIAWFTSLESMNWQLNPINHDQVKTMVSPHINPIFIMMHFLKLGVIQISYNISIDKVGVSSGSLGNILFTGRFQLVGSETFVPIFTLQYSITAQNAGTKINWGSVYNPTAIEQRTYAFLQSILNMWRGGDSPGMHNRKSNYPYGERGHQINLESAYLAGRGEATLQLGDTTIGDSATRTASYEKIVKEARERLAQKLLTLRRECYSAYDKENFKQILTKLEADLLLLKSYAVLAGFRATEIGLLNKLPNKDEILSRFDQFFNKGNIAIPNDLFNTLKPAETAIFKCIEEHSQNQKSREGLTREGLREEYFQSALKFRLRLMLLNISALTIKLRTAPKPPTNLEKEKISVFAQAVARKLNKSNPKIMVSIWKALKEALKFIQPKLNFVLPNRKSGTMLGKWEFVAVDLQQFLIHRQEQLIGQGDSPEILTVDILEMIKNWLKVSQYRYRPFVIDPDLLPNQGPFRSYMPQFHSGYFGKRETPQFTQEPIDVSAFGNNCGLFALTLAIKKGLKIKPDLKKSIRVPGFFDSIEEISLQRDSKQTAQIAIQLRGELHKVLLNDNKYKERLYVDSVAACAKFIAYQGNSEDAFSKILRETPDRESFMKSNIAFMNKLKKEWDDEKNRLKEAQEESIKFFHEIKNYRINEDTLKQVKAAIQEILQKGAPKDSYDVVFQTVRIVGKVKNSIKEAINLWMLIDEIWPEFIEMGQPAYRGEIKDKIKNDLHNHILNLLSGEDGIKFETKLLSYAFANVRGHDSEFFRREFQNIVQTEAASIFSEYSIDNNSNGSGALYENYVNYLKDEPVMLSSYELCILARAWGVELRTIRREAETIDNWHTANNDVLKVTLCNPNGNHWMVYPNWGESFDKKKDKEDEKERTEPSWGHSFDKGDEKSEGRGAEREEKKAGCGR